MGLSWRSPPLTEGKVQPARRHSDRHHLPAERKGHPGASGRGRGDQYVTVRVAVPLLNGEQKEALRAFAAAMGEIPAQEEEEGLKGFFDKRKRKK